MYIFSIKSKYFYYIYESIKKEQNRLDSTYENNLLILKIPISVITDDVIDNFCRSLISLIQDVSQ